MFQLRHVTPYSVVIVTHTDSLSFVVSKINSKSFSALYTLSEREDCPLETRLGFGLDMGHGNGMGPEAWEIRTGELQHCFHFHGGYPLQFFVVFCVVVLRSGHSRMDLVPYSSRRSTSDQWRTQHIECSSSAQYS